MKLKNKVITKNSIVDLEDYFGSELEFFNTSLRRIKLNYNLLRERDSIKVEKYEKAIDEVMEDLQEKRLEDPFEDVTGEKHINLNYIKMTRIGEVEESCDRNEEF